MLNIIIGALIYVAVFIIDDSYELCKVWGMMLSRIFISNYGYIVWVSVHEIFATPMRSAGFAMAMIFSRSGAIFAPFIKDIGDLTHSSIPCLIIVSFCGGIICCVYKLPETLNKPLPDTIDDMRKLYINEKHQSIEIQNIK